MYRIFTLHGFVCLNGLTECGWSFYTSIGWLCDVMVSRLKEGKGRKGQGREREKWEKTKGEGN